MNDEQQEITRYKWDQPSGSGYRLRYDAVDPEHCYHVEDCDNHVVMDHWGCADLDEALDVLNQHFDIDVSEERARVSAWLPSSMH
ncbi:MULTISPECIES: hypothetical protein [Thiorhodovibrio]|jgi:hypothetical protein|uniref:hypothetical protein n=1 Tax=Thiorhodovibrio TaxID=61593 RepID=UPI001914134B|nr:MULTISPECIES: hypothetical protein [Thiorhodovibrio]MBK5968031.1 hypothetical protein [Thiorhodovibrio winogradskyi]WPL11847.1 hypothetical protein Thiosp_01599 [Thiorhodovibrio litoralis]